MDAISSFYFPADVYGSYSVNKRRKKRRIDTSTQLRPVPRPHLPPPQETKIEALQREMSLKIEGLTKKERKDSGLLQEENLRRMADIILQETEKKLREENRQERNLRGQNLSGQDLVGQNFAEWGWDLRKVNLQGTDLRDTNLAITMMQGANLRGAVLIGTNLSGAQLQGADLRETLLRGAKLVSADLEGADLSLADLRKTDLQGTHNLTVEQLAKAIVDKTTKLPKGITLKAIRKAMKAEQQASEPKPPAPSGPS